MLHTIAAFDRIGEENAFAVLARATALAAQGKDIINLGIGQPDFRRPTHIVEAAIKALRDGHHGYTPANGLLATARGGGAPHADHHRRRGLARDVMIMPGGKPTMFAAILMFGEPGAEILYPDPGLPDLSLDDRVHRCGPDPGADPRGERLRLLRRGDAVADHAEDAAPHPQLAGQPDRRRHAPAEIDKLVAGLAAHPDVAIMSDEIYDVMTYDGETACSLLQFPEIRDRLIVLNGWSKTWAMTGWRMGWSIWPNGEPATTSTTRCASSPSTAGPASTRRAQFAGIAAIDGPQDEVATMMKAFDRRRQVVVEGLNALPGVSCITPKGAFYAFPNISATGWKAKKLASALLEEAGVALIGGPDFGILGEGYIRLSYANSEENILRALERIEAFLARSQNHTGEA